MSEAAPPATAAPPEKSFADFMFTKIGEDLKANPKLPSLNKDVVGGAPPTEGQPQSQPPKPESKPQIPETTPEQSAKALLPDFSKLAFGQQSEKATVEEKREAVPQGKETPVAEDFPEVLPGTGTAQAQETWARLRTSNQALSKQNAKLTTQLKDLQEKIKEFDGKTPMASDEYDRLTTERDELVKELRLVKLESTPEYKKAVLKPLETVEAEIKRLSTKYNVNQHQVRSALTEPDRDKQGELLSKVTDTFNDRDKMVLFRLADDAKEIFRRRAVLQDDVKQALDYIEAKRAADAEKSKTEAVTEWTGAQKKAWQVIGDAVYLARPLEGNDEWNRALEESKQLVAKTDLGALDATDKAKVLVQAALLPRALRAIHQLWDMYQEAAGALKRYQGVTPGAGSGHSTGGEAPSESSENGEMSFVDAIESKITGRR
jgi:hypothetical protein